MSDQVQRVFPPPHDVCLKCWAGDTDTHLLVWGDAALLAAVYVEHVGPDEGHATRVSDALYADKGLPTDRRTTHMLRLCRTCAAATGAPVTALGRQAGELDVVMREEDWPAFNAARRVGEWLP